jgi:hypothetical protein
MKRGIIQSRGLGDIIIALPIARHYYNLGDEIHWPICEEFHSSVRDSVPWVTWHPIPTDPQGRFFLERPLEIFQEQGIDIDEALYLYQYLSSHPEHTDPEMFAVMKFDQYKYWVAAVPFLDKWTLRDCITRFPDREKALAKKLKLKGPYAVSHLTGSDCRANLDINWLENLAIVNVDDHLTDSIFDWLGILEGASAFVGIDSVFANLVDCYKIDIPEKYWLRRSSWDLTPVLGSSWTMIPNGQNLADPQRVVIADAVNQKNKGLTARAAPAPTAAPQPLPQHQLPQSGQLKSSVPFQSNQNYPSDFMSVMNK